jgi:transposase-like protein
MKASNNRSSRRERRHFTGQQKSAIVKRHLVDGVPVSDLCDQHHILPTQFYQWQKQLFENGGAAFDRKGKTTGKSAQDRKIEQLEAKLQSKNEVIAELMEENVKAKKECGEL